MPSSSKSQQRLFGMVHACKKTGKCASPEVAKIADGISAKDAEEFARTKHAGLPERKPKQKKSKLKSYKEYTDEQSMMENLNHAGRQMAGMTMNDPRQAIQAAKQAGVSVNKYYRIMSGWIQEMNSKLADQGGDSQHGMSIQILQSIMNAAAGGQKQWGASQQLKNMKTASTSPVQQQQQPQQTNGMNQGGPTPLSSIK